MRIFINIILTFILLVLVVNADVLYVENKTNTQVNVAELVSTGRVEAKTYALPSNSIDIPDPIIIPTNSTYIISYTNGPFTSYSFESGATEPILISILSPGAGKRSQHEIYFESGYTSRFVTYTNDHGGFRWINDPPTTDEAQIMFLSTGTNIVAINTTVVE